MNIVKMDIGSVNMVAKRGLSGVETDISSTAGLVTIK